MTYGFVVAHDTDTMMTYYIPALTILQSVSQQCGLPSLTMLDNFDLTGSSISEADNNTESTAKVDEPLAPTEEPEKELILQTYLEKIRSYTIENVDGQQYILTSSLVDWLVAKANPIASHLDILLDYVYAQNFMVPINTVKVSVGSQKCLLVFSILLELGHGYLIDKFQQHNLTDDRLPFALAQLEDTMAKMELIGVDWLARKFSEKQWAYLPMHFEYGASFVCPPQRIVPIHQRQRINDKGGIATLWRVVILEAFVDHDLRQVASNARYNESSDFLGYVSTISNL